MKTLKLYVRGREELHDLPALDLAISINDPGDDVSGDLSALADEVMPLSFHDAEDDEQGAGFVLPQSWHLELVRRRLEARPPATLLVQCTFGISRSPAVALYSLAVLSPQWSARRLVDALFEVRPEAAPNARLIRLAEADLHKQLRRALKHAP